MFHKLIASELPKNWWPLCAVCGKVVDNLEVVPLPPNPNIYQCAIRDYIVTCHGKNEKHIVGIWAAHSIAIFERRLPDAFTNPTPLPADSSSPNKVPLE